MKMEFTALFLCVLVVMAASWWGSHRLALALFSIVLAASVATYLHHATDTLNLSF
jgi:general stress protein CsbA